MKHLWVIEINFKDGKGWSPTIDSSLSREEARNDMIDWCINNPDDKFRITKYIPNNIRPDGTLMVEVK